MRFETHQRIALALYAVALRVLLCSSVAAQTPQAGAPAGAIRLVTGRTVPMKLTVENKCPTVETFSVTTEGLPAGFVHPPSETSIAGNSSTETKLTLDTTTAEPGLYTGAIVVTCTSCGPECVQNRKLFPVQFLVERQSPQGQSDQKVGETPTASPPTPGATASTGTTAETPHTTSRGPCPCEDLCRAAVSAEMTAQGRLEDYERASNLVETLQSLIRTTEQSARQDRDLANHYSIMGGYDAEVERLGKQAADLQKQIDEYDQKLKELEKQRDDAADKYSRAAAEAAFARAKCDACLAEHPECPQSPWKAGGFTTEKPPDPDAPYMHELHAPDEIPPPVRPPRQPADDHNGHRNEKVEDCPERHRGCIALVVDMMKNDPNTRFFRDREQELKKQISTTKDEQLKKVYEDALLYLPKRTDLSGKLTRAGCAVDREEPDFWPDPDPITLAVGNGQTITMPIPDAVHEHVRLHNATENAKLALAIEQHRTAIVEKKPEIAIEVIDAHGGGAWDLDRKWRCGSVGPGYDTRVSSLFRADFHEGNYRAANKNVCDWFTMDLSCYGGLTPKVVDELDNLATSTCKAASTIDCGNHAGWESDGSTASATAIATCSYGTAYRQESLLGEALDRQAGRNQGHPAEAPDFSLFLEDLRRVRRGGTSFYGDRGYAKDHPPMHTHVGYPTRATPGRCSGGMCGQ